MRPRARVSKADVVEKVGKNFAEWANLCIFAGTKGGRAFSSASAAGVCARSRLNTTIIK